MHPALWCSKTSFMPGQPNNNMMHNFKSNRGFVLLYAVLVSSIVITVGLLLANILLKQLVIASTARDAKIAYYAADSGRDCALFWINELGPYLFDSDITITCNNRSVDISINDFDSPIARGNSFNYRVTLPGSGNIPKRCADVEVYHGVPDVDSGAPDDDLSVLATVRAYGYSGDCDSTSPRLVQRFIETTVIQ